LLWLLVANNPNSQTYQDSPKSGNTNTHQEEKKAIPFDILVISKLDQREQNQEILS